MQVRYLRRSAEMKGAAMTTTLHPKDQEVLDSLHISCLPFAEQRVYLDRILEALATMGAQERVRERLHDKGLLR